MTATLKSPKNTLGSRPSDPFYAACKAAQRQARNLSAAQRRDIAQRWLTTSENPTPHPGYVNVVAGDVLVFEPDTLLDRVAATLARQGVIPTVVMVTHRANTERLITAHRRRAELYDDACYLHEVEGLSYSEVAETLGISEHSARQRIGNATSRSKVTRDVVQAALSESRAIAAFVRGFWDEHGHGPAWEGVAAQFGWRNRHELEEIMVHLHARNVLTSNRQPRSLRTAPKPIRYSR